MSIVVDQKKWGVDYVQGVAPSNPKAGMSWFDTDTKNLKIYNSLNLITDIVDNSASEHVITKYGDIGTSRDGKISSCIAFDGTDYCYLGDSNDWAFDANFTIDLWLKHNSPDTAMVIMGQADSGSSNLSFQIRIGDSGPAHTKMIFTIYDSAGTTPYSITSPNDTPLGEWFHVVISRTSTTMNMYINGAIVATTTFSGASFNSAYSMAVGRLGEYAGQYYIGNVEEIRISKGIDRTTDINDPLYIDGAYKGNSEHLFKSIGNDLSIWTIDNDAGNGTTTISAFQGNDCIKCDSGSAGSSNESHQGFDVGDTPDKWVISTKLYHDQIGTEAAGDGFQLSSNKSDMQFYALFTSDGLLIYDGSSYNEVGTDLVELNTWQEWEFIIDGTTAASATCDIFLDGIQVGTSVDCSYTGSFTDGVNYVGQLGDTAANNITYVDYHSVGGWQSFIPPTNHYDNTTEDSNTKLLIQSTGGASWHRINLGPGMYGYQTGGNGSGAYSIIERLEFPFDSGTMNLVGNLNNTTMNTTGFNSTTHGYNVCGYNGSNRCSTMERITFPFNSGLSTVVGNMAHSKSNSAQFNSSIHGYSCGGHNGANATSDIDRITFPHDSGTGIDTGGNLTKSGYYQTGCNSSTHGYILGGDNGVGIKTSILDRIIFPHDSGDASNTGNLSGIRANNSSFNSSTHGYLCGGGGSPYYSWIERIVFPFASGTGSNVGHLSTAMSTCCGMNSSNYGYVLGGYGGSSLSTIQRIRFPFNSGTALVVGNMNTSRVGGTIDETDFITIF